MADADAEYDPQPTVDSPPVTDRSQPYKSQYHSKFMVCDAEYACGQLRRFKSLMARFTDTKVAFKPRQVEQLLCYFPEFCQDLREILAGSEVLLAYLRTFPPPQEPAAV
jgi:hypothetical protein